MYGFIVVYFYANSQLFIHYSEKFVDITWVIFHMAFITLHNVNEMNCK